jgi:hypothetical protein
MGPAAGCGRRPGLPMTMVIPVHKELYGMILENLNFEFTNFSDQQRGFYILVIKIVKAYNDIT